MTNKYEEIFVALSEIHTEYLQIQPHLSNKQQLMLFAITDLLERLDVLLERLEIINTEIDPDDPTNTYLNTYVPKLRTLLETALTSHEK